MNILGVLPLKQIRTGGDRRYLELMELLAERGNSVFVIMNAWLEYTPLHFTKIALPVSYTPHGFPPGSFLFKKVIKKNLSLSLEFARNKGCAAFDIIHIHGDMFLKSALFLRKKLRIPLFYASRCNDIDRAHIMRSKGALSSKEYFFSFVYEAINRFREKQTAKYAELITFQNTVDRDIFLKRTKCAVEKTVIIPGNIGLPRCAPGWENRNKSDKLKNIVYIGALSPSKGICDLLKALKRIKEKGYKLHCYVLGRIENASQTMELIERLDIKDRISIEGFKNPFSYLADCDLMVYPTLYDAYPDAVLEALHTGCPVIASAVGGLPDMLKRPELLFEAGDVEEIAHRMERCIKESEFYERIRSLCAERAQAHRFDWAEQFEKAMRKALAPQVSSLPILTKSDNL
ncbi:MAG: glycosyltransferase family 4 protein [Treponema sp.]|jgi:glycosyltransferase involved in cell wall biosynthesis|nr:glycosyltransferase family 4 protein [Treponema sp.]